MGKIKRLVRRISAWLVNKFTNFDRYFFSIIKYVLIWLAMLFLHAFLLLIIVGTVDILSSKITSVSLWTTIPLAYAIGAFFVGTGVFAVAAVGNIIESWHETRDDIRLERFNMIQAAQNERHRAAQTLEQLFAEQRVQNAFTWDVTNDRLPGDDESFEALTEDDYGDWGDEQTQSVDVRTNSNYPF